MKRDIFIIVIIVSLTVVYLPGFVSSVFSRVILPIYNTLTYSLVSTCSIVFQNVKSFPGDADFFNHHYLLSFLHDFLKILYSPFHTLIYIFETAFSLVLQSVKVVFDEATSIDDVISCWNDYSTNVETNPFKNVNASSLDVKYCYPLIHPDFAYKIRSNT